MKIEEQLNYHPLIRILLPYPLTVEPLNVEHSPISDCQTGCHEIIRELERTVNSGTIVFAMLDLPGQFYIVNC